MSGASDRFWSQLQALYQASGTPTLGRLVRLGLEQRPEISVSDSTINGWLNRKAIPTGPKNERYLGVMVAFLQSRVKPGSSYVRLSPGEWGGLLRAAQSERAAKRQRGRPGRLLASGPAKVYAFPSPRDEFEFPPPGVLIGRESELRMLRQHVKAVASGQGGVLLIEGEPGIGKSALVRAALSEAAEFRCQVFWGSGDELGQVMPLQPLLDALRVREAPADPRRNTICRLLRGEAVSDGGLNAEAVLSEHLLALLADLCATHPTILVIDDLQWADKASVRLWCRLARSAHQIPLLLVAMMRPVPQRDDVRALQRLVGDLARHRLTGLNTQAVTDLTTALCGGSPDPGLLHLTSGAAGNPLYITELVGALNRADMVTVTNDGVAELETGAVPESLTAAIADRLSFVSEPAKEVLHAAALLGTDFAVADLVIVTDRSLPGLIPVLREAQIAGVLTESRRGLRFRHPLIRSALYDTMPAPVRALWHKQAGRALAAAGAPEDRVARQLSNSIQAADDSPEPLDAWILDWLASAADALIAQAPRIAAQLLLLASRGSPHPLPRDVWLASRLADALYRTGDRAQAEQVASHAVEHATEPDLLVDLHWTMAQSRMVAGHSALSLATLDGALRAPGIAARHRARLLTLIARTHSHLGNSEEAGEAAASALASASEARDSWAMAWALHVQTLVMTVQGYLTEALPIFDQAMTVTRAEPALTDLQLLLQINLAVTLGSLDRYEEAFAAARQVKVLAHQAGTAVRQAQVHFALAQLLYQTGKWDEAILETRALPDDLKESPVACCDLSLSAIIGFHRGDSQAARGSLAKAMPYAQQIGDRLIGPLVLARSLDREHEGQPFKALEILVSACHVHSEEVGAIEDILPDTVRLAVATGDTGTARALVDQAVKYTAGSAIPHWQGHQLYCQGMLECDARQLLNAADRYREACRPLLRAQALEAATDVLLRGGDRDRARHVAYEATAIYGGLGAKVDVDRLLAKF